MDKIYSLVFVSDNQNVGLPNIGLTGLSVCKKFESHTVDHFFASDLV